MGPHHLPPIRKLFPPNMTHGEPKVEEICFDCGAYQDVATFQDLDALLGNIEKTRISIRWKILIPLLKV